MKNIKLQALLLFIILLFLQCSPEKKVIEFQSREEQKIVNNIEQFLKFMNYTDYKIISTIHVNLVGDIASKKIVTELFNGYGYNPEGPAGIEENNIPVKNPKEDDYSNYDRREFIGNYNIKDRLKYEFDYISVLIIFENISQKEIGNIKEIIKGSFLNRNRGDTLMITSKK
ncbi:MAG: hypothetical protein JW982_13935 [Spirochaetes bacterium]|nr:hypothetical protein [Spirochaetota bacterium]